jgi:ClpP class serine protease
MSLNFELAREIYGIGVWSVDSKTLPAMLQILANSKMGQELELPNKKYNSVSILNVKSDDYEDCEECEMYEPTNEDIQGIAVVHLDGAITVGGGQSSYGMTDLSQRMLELNKNDNVKGFIVYTNSGGGSTMAVEIMTDAISEIRKTKPVFGLVKKGGMAASAAYAILSACEEIYAESEMSTVGSCGTMIQFEGKAANTLDEDGYLNVRLYATKSSKKNLAVEEALNKNNYSIIIDEMLNPINERFLSLVETNRPVLKGTDFSDGHDAYAKDSIGKFIDGISTQSEVIKKVILKTKSNSGSNSNSNINSNLKKMNKSEIKQNHSEVYSEIVNEGIAIQKEIVAGWIPFYEADSKAVIEGIQSGEAIKDSQKNAFLVAIANKGKVADLSADNAANVVTEQTSTVVDDADENESEKEAKAAFNFNL